jgi:hypothetical protein
MPQSRSTQAGKQSISIHLNYLLSTSHQSIVPLLFNSGAIKQEIGSKDELCISVGSSALGGNVVIRGDA